jgi:prepilin-type N-terminal cleavage/methylation domain-containing protein
MLVSSPDSRSDRFRQHPFFAQRGMVCPPCFQQGFSLIEMMIAVSIALILGVTGFVLAQNVAQGVRLSGSCTSYANLLQTARIRAVQDDRYYAVVSDTVANPPRAFVDINANGFYDAGEPMMVFAQSVTPQPFASGPSIGNLKLQFLPATGQNTVNAANPPTFGPRGLPCLPSAPVNGVCNYLQATSYITFVQNTLSTKWEAITVTPAGRVRLWSYDAASSTWSGLN